MVLADTRHTADSSNQRLIIFRFFPADILRLTEAMEFILFLGFFLLLNAGRSYQALVRDCGKPERVIMFDSATVHPDPVLYPGNVTLTSVVNVLRNLPESGLIISTDLYKLDPEPTHIPCYSGLGSCKHDVCEAIEKYPEYFCRYFPTGVECGCPIKAGRYDIDNVGQTLPDYGPDFAKMIEGKYEAMVTLLDKSTEEELGCFTAKFQIVANVLI